MTHSSAPLTPAFWLAVAGRTIRGALRQADAILTVLRHRREIKHLAELDDRTLKDIGLVRSDVHSALAEPMLRNPYTVLVRTAERNSRGRRTFAARPLRPVVPLVKAQP